MTHLNVCGMFYPMLSRKKDAMAHTMRAPACRQSGVPPRSGRPEIPTDGMTMIKVSMLVATFIQTSCLVPENLVLDRFAALAKTKKQVSVYATFRNSG
jgi:hypothetical protein